MSSLAVVFLSTSRMVNFLYSFNVGARVKTILILYLHAKCMKLREKNDITFSFVGFFKEKSYNFLLQKKHESQKNDVNAKRYRC